jgi:hypothetical protein
MAKLHPKPGMQLLPELPEMTSLYRARVLCFCFYYGSYDRSQVVSYAHIRFLFTVAGARLVEHISTLEW